MLILRGARRRRAELAIATALGEGLGRDESGSIEREIRALMEE